MSPYLPPLSTPYLPPDDHGAEGGPCQPGTRSRGNSVLAQSRQCSSPHAGPPRASPAPRRSGHRVLKRQYDNAGVTRFGRTGPGIEGTDGVIISRTTHMCRRRMVITPSRSFNALSVKGWVFCVTSSVRNHPELSSIVRIANAVAAWPGVPGGIASFRRCLVDSRSFNARHQVVPSICPLMSTEERACGSNGLLPERCNRPRIAPLPYLSHQERAQPERSCRRINCAA